MMSEHALISMSAQRVIMIAATFAQIPMAAIDAAVQVANFYQLMEKLAKIPIYAQLTTAVAVRFVNTTITTPFVHVEMVSRLI
jgi:hypothetical protein